MADYYNSTSLLAASTLRNVLGTKNLSELLTERENIAGIIKISLDIATVSQILLLFLLFKRILQLL